MVLIIQLIFLLKKEIDNLAKFSKVIYPSSRWRDNFDEITEGEFNYAFVSSDNKTAVPETFDLCRSCAVFSVSPKQKKEVYVVNEKLRSTLKYEVNEFGKLQNKVIFTPRGQYCSISDRDGNVYVADGEVFIFEKNGKEQRRIAFDERPVSIALGGKEQEFLLVTSNTSLYIVKIK